MKKLIIALLFPVCIHAQQKNDSKIIVKADDTTGLFNRVAIALLDRGFSFDQKDETLRYIQTGEKKVNEFGSMKARVLIKADSVIITGTYALDQQIAFSGIKSERAFEPIKNRGMKGSLWKMSWDELARIAETIPGQKTYTK